MSEGHAVTDAAPGQNLDPEDWQAFRRFAHEIVEAMVDRMSEVREGPVWRPVPPETRARIAAPAPGKPASYAELRQDLEALVLPYSVGNTHPRFWGWVHGSGTPGGALAEFVAGALNANCGGRDHGAIYFERAILKWASDWFGLPDSAGGLLVSGSSMANILGLAAARHKHGGADLREKGLRGKPLVAYASAQAHSSLAKAVELLGLGREALRAIPVGADYRMDPAALKRGITRDCAAGFIPFAVVATAGTVNTGAFDPIPEIADICERETLWLHIDGAFGSLVKLTRKFSALAEGVERANSLAFDFHKWLHVPYDAGCVLVSDASYLGAAFGGRPDYLASAGGLAAGEPWPSDYGVELSRGFRALKIWWTIKEQGLERLGQAIERNCAQAQYLVGRLSAHENIEISARRRSTSSAAAIVHKILTARRSTASTPRSWWRSRRAGWPPLRRHG